MRKISGALVTTVITITCAVGGTYILKSSPTRESELTIAAPSTLNLEDKVHEASETRLENAKVETRVWPDQKKPKKQPVENASNKPALPARKLTVADKKLLNETFKPGSSCLIIHQEEPETLAYVDDLAGYLKILGVGTEKKQPKRITIDSFSGKYHVASGKDGRIIMYVLNKWKPE